MITRNHPTDKPSEPEATLPVDFYFEPAMRLIAAQHVVIFHSAADLRRVLAEIKAATAPYLVRPKRKVTPSPIKKLPAKIQPKK